MIQPTGERVLIEPVAESEKSNGGILLPQNVVRHQEFAEGIVRSYRKVFGDLNGITLGTRVMYATASGYTINDPKGKTFRIINEEDILAVVT